MNPHAVINSKRRYRDPLHVVDISEVNGDGGRPTAARAADCCYPRSNRRALCAKENEGGKEDGGQTLFIGN